MVSAELVISTAEGGASAWMVVAKAHRRVGVGRALLGATRA
jgi:GNAT superfamily N-acetyltransferase